MIFSDPSMDPTLSTMVTNRLLVATVRYKKKAPNSRGLVLEKLFYVGCHQVQGGPEISGPLSYIHPLRQFLHLFEAYIIGLCIVSHRAFELFNLFPQFFSDILRPSRLCTDHLLALLFF